MYSRLRFAAQMLLLLVPNISPTPLLTGLTTKNAQFQVASIDSAGRGHSILDGQIILVKKHLSVMLLCPLILRVFQCLRNIADS
jgi:hypothetical protein